MAFFRGKWPNLLVLHDTSLNGYSGPCTYSQTRSQFLIQNIQGCLYNKPISWEKKPATVRCGFRCRGAAQYHLFFTNVVPHVRLDPLASLRRVRACQAGTRDRWADGSIGHKMPCNYGIFAFMHQDLFFWKMCHPDLNMNIADIIEQFILPSGYLTVCHGQSPCY